MRFDFTKWSPEQLALLARAWALDMEEGMVRMLNPQDHTAPPERAPASLVSLLRELAQRIETRAP